MARKILREALVLSVFFFCSAQAGAAWEPGPLVWKGKWREGNFFSRTGWSFTYRTGDLRWEWSLVHNDPSSDDRLSYLDTSFRKRAGGTWWYGTGGRLSTQPACTYRELRLFLENTARTFWSGRLWAEGEHRLPSPSSRLDEYFYSELGARVRRREGGFMWLTELKMRQKNYQTSLSSWRKYHLETGGDARLAGHFFSLRYRESTGEYPEDAWKNEWRNSWVAEWEWTVTGKTFLAVRCSRLLHEWGENKKREEWDLAGRLEHPRTPDSTVSWMVDYREAVRRDLYLGEEEEERYDPGFRWGVRWQRVFPRYNLRTEFFQSRKGDEIQEGILLILQLERENIRCQVGLAPRGGFSPSEEKGYWVEIRYYI